VDGAGSGATVSRGRVATLLERKKAANTGGLVCLRAPAYFFFFAGACLAAFLAAFLVAFFIE
jgi:hypothetical protein